MWSSVFLTAVVARSLVAAVAATLNDRKMWSMYLHHLCSAATVAAAAAAAAALSVRAFLFCFSSCFFNGA